MQEISLSLNDAGKEFYFHGDVRLIADVPDATQITVYDGKLELAPGTKIGAECLLASTIRDKKDSDVALLVVPEGCTIGDRCVLISDGKMEIMSDTGNFVTVQAKQLVGTAFGMGTEIKTTGKTDIISLGALGSVEADSAVIQTIEEGADVTVTKRLDSRQAGPGVTISASIAVIDKTHETVRINGQAPTGGGRPVHKAMATSPSLP